jgi:serine/threonine-protein kinase
VTLRAGTTLSGRYTLASLIAVGGMGEVWRAQDGDLSRLVAVKVLKDSATGNDTFLRRFRNEAKNAAGLAHPNIAQVYDYGDHDGTAFLVMEFVDGEPLSSILERERTISEARVVRILDQTSQGLAVAHAAGVMHRDIKPGNLLVFDDDKVKITDFGVSRGMDQTTLTATGMVMGTAQYLAPELALGKPATPASDIYALGIIAYESVIGRRPFTAPNAVDIAIAQVNEPVPPLPDTVSPGMRDLIGLLLEKNPRKRPRTAEELQRVLAALSVPDAVPAPVGTAPERRPAKRNMPPSIAPREYRPRPDVRRSPS